MTLDDKKFFFLSGFQKSGTSTIHEWLKQLDVISLPNIKETHLDFEYHREFVAQW